MSRHAKSKHTERVLNLLKSQNEIGFTEVCKKLNIQTNQLYNALCSLERDGVLVCEDKHKLSLYENIKDMPG